MSTDAHDRKLEKAREYKLSHKEEIKKWQDAKNASIANDPVLRAKRNEANRRSMKNNYAHRKAYDEQRDRLKTNARAYVRNRIHRGLLERGCCEKCGEANAQAHHEDYSKPLEIVWVCAKHHKELHDEK